MIGYYLLEDYIMSTLKLQQQFARGRFSGMRKLRYLLLVFICLFFYITGCDKVDRTGIDHADTSLPELKDHPVYRNYNFSHNLKVIDFGVQPFWVPTSNISEIMRIDNILREELHALGYRLNVLPFFKGNDVNYFLKSGDLEVGIGGDMPAIRAAASDDVIIISIIQEGPVSIVSKGIGEVRTLKGKKIAYALGSNAHFYLLNTLRKNSVNISEVKLVQLDVPDMPEALHEKRIDAFAAWEPTPAIALDRYKDLMVTHRGKSYGFLYVKKDLFDRSPEVVYHLLASEIRALRWLKKNDRNLHVSSKMLIDASLTLTSQGIPLNMEQISALAKKDLPGIDIKHYPRIPAYLLSQHGMLKKEYEFLKNLGLISQDKTWEEIKIKFDLNVIETVISAPLEYRLFEEINFDSHIE